MVQIDCGFSDQQERALIDFLHVNQDIFAWKPSDMSRIPREVIEHSLDILPSVKPVKQRLRHFNDEKQKAIGDEIARLLAIRFIKEVFHHEWIANLVLVRKKNGTWKMCVDYMNLNKA
jgi:hypothetical protein